MRVIIYSVVERIIYTSQQFPVYFYYWLPTLLAVQNYIRWFVIFHLPFTSLPFSWTKISYLKPSTMPAEFAEIWEGQGSKQYGQRYIVVLEVALGTGIQNSSSQWEHLTHILPPLYFLVIVNYVDCLLRGRGSELHNLWPEVFYPHQFLCGWRPQRRHLERIEPF